MNIVVTPTKVDLQDDSNFRHFATVAPEGTDLDAVLREAGAGYFAGSHAWIDPSWIEREAKGDEAWKIAFTAMLQFARSNEWIDSVTGFIRSHIEEPPEETSGE